MVIVHQSFGDQLRWNPHFHAIVLEGGFDDEGTFFYIPFSGLQSMVDVFLFCASPSSSKWGILHCNSEGSKLAPNTPKGLQLIRRYGLYASRTKGRWEEMPWVAQRAPDGWKATHSSSAGNDHIGFEPLSDRDEQVNVDARKRARARLLAKVYEVDPVLCPKCGAEMKLIAVIEDPDELRRILRHKIKLGRSPRDSTLIGLTDSFLGLIPRETCVRFPVQTRAKQLRFALSVHLPTQIAAAGDVMRPRNAVGAGLSRNSTFHYRFAVTLADNFSYC
jgi:hypothetical protein